MLADEVDYVVGVDTHRDEHVLAVVAAPAGAVVAQRSVRRTTWLREALRSSPSRASGSACLGGRGSGPLRCWACPLSERPRRDGDRDRPWPTRRAAAARQGRWARRGPGRSDGVGKPEADPAEGGAAAGGAPPAAVARRGAVDVRRQAIVQLRSVIVTAPEQLREELRGCPTGAADRALQPAPTLQTGRPDEWPAGRAANARPTIRAATQKPASSKRRSTPTSASRTTAARRARRRPDRRRPDHRRLVTPRPRPLRSRLRTPRRRRTDPRLSGQTTRHRLSRGGDRQLNRALHTVILHRRQHDPATKDYIARRISEGKTSRDATRLVKRYLARHLYRATQQQVQITT